MVCIHIDLLIGTYIHRILFYDLTDLSKPRLIGIDDKTHTGGHNYHGMICKFINKDKTGGNIIDIELLLFGGYRKEFIELLIHFNFDSKLNSNYELSDINELNFNNKIKIKQNKIEINPKYYISTMIGYNTIINSKNERILLIIGGQSYNGKSILLYNCHTNQLFEKYGVCLCMYCI